MKTQYAANLQRYSYIVRKIFTPSYDYCEEFDEESFIKNKKVVLEEFNKRANKAWIDRFSIK